MDRQLLIKQIRSITTKEDLLTLLNAVHYDFSDYPTYTISHKQLMRLCNSNSDRARYYTFDIRKKTGGFRTINAPNRPLKNIQRCLNEIYKAIYTPSKHAMGFVPGRSIVHNAIKHLNQNYVFNIDLSDFFTSIDQARVWKRLMLPPFNFNSEIANIMAGLCAIKTVRLNNNGELTECYCLPQGAPTSPILTNAICDTLDRQLAGLAKRFRVHYSRYADDITFSSMHNVYQPDSEFRVELERIVSQQRFSINEKKIRLHHRGSRQEVTGLTVGEKVNVTRKYVKDIRAILYIWEHYGIKDAYAAFYPRYKAQKGHLRKGTPTLQNVISGKLCFLKMVKGDTDPVYKKLQAQFDKLMLRDPLTKTTQCSWEYLKTYDIPDFEKIFNTKIKYTTSKTGIPYGYFIVSGRKIFVSISCNINERHDINKMKISLCSRTDFKIQLDVADSNYYIRHFNDTPNIFERMERGCPVPDDIGTRFQYLIHLPNFR